MESTPYININVCESNQLSTQYVINFDIFYEYRTSEGCLVANCAHTLNEWHKKKYGSVCPYSIYDEEDETIVKYQNQFVKFVFKVSKKSFTLNSCVVEGYNV